MKKLLRISLHLMATLYILAGLNHFIRPENYLSLIPPYFPAPEYLNILAGIAEVVFGLGLHFSKTRYWSAWGIIAMLIAFLPVHIIHAYQKVYVYLFGQAGLGCLSFIHC